MIKIGPQELRRDISEMSFSVFVTLPSLRTLHGSDTFEVKCRLQLRGTNPKAQDAARAAIAALLRGVGSFVAQDAARAAIVVSR